jgi:hypothetical protein
VTDAQRKAQRKYAEANRLLLCERSKARGGPHVHSNIKVACAACNMKKGARLLAA